MTEPTVKDMPVKHYTLNIPVYWNADRTTYEHVTIDIRGDTITLTVFDRPFTIWLTPTHIDGLYKEVHR